MSGCQWTLPNYIHPDCVDIEMWHKAWEVTPGVRKIVIKWERQELHRESLFSEEHAVKVAKQGGAHREFDPHGLEIHLDVRGKKKIHTAMTRRANTFTVYTLPPPTKVGPRFAYEMFTEAVRAFEQIARVAAKAVAQSIQPRVEDQWVAASRRDEGPEYQV